MIKEALQYIVGLSEAKTMRVNVIAPDGSEYEQIYSDKELHRLSPYLPKAEDITMNTLSSFVDYIKSRTDRMAEKMIIHVKAPDRVELYSQLDSKRERETLVSIVASIPDFNYGRFIPHENFLIGVQSKFIDDIETDKALVLQFAGTVEAGTVQQYSDDGISQSATIKQGIASKQEGLVPGKVKLRPYRTFIEVEQPVSEFIFRMKNDEREGVLCAIFEADGGAWKNEAKDNIKNYLKEQLSVFEDIFTIIS